MDSLSGATTNLLRMARSESRAAAAFVAVALDDDTFATATYRATPADELLSGEVVDDLIRQAWNDPKFGTGKVLVRMARLASRRLGPGRRMALAIVPLVDGPGKRPWGFLGVVGPEAGTFDCGQIALLERIAQRLSSYFRARQEVRQQLPPDVAAGKGAAGAATAAASSPAAPFANQPTAITDRDWSAMATPAPTEEAAWGIPPRADLGSPSVQLQPPGTAHEPPVAGFITEMTAGQPVWSEPMAATGMPTAPPVPAWEQVGAPAPQESEAIWGSGTRVEYGEGAWSPAHGGSPRGTEAQMPSGAERPIVRLGDEVVWGTTPMVPSPPPFAVTGEPASEFVAPAGHPAPVVSSDAAAAESRAAEPPRAERATAERETVEGGTGMPGRPTDASRAPFSQRAEAAGGSDPLADLLRGADPATGLVPLGALLGRAGRMLGASVAGGGTLVLVVVEVMGEIDEDAMVVAAHALRGQLRFDDPVAQVGGRAFVAAVPLVSGSSTGANVEEHLVSTVRSAIASDAASVRSAHVVADLAGRHDADELLRQAVAKLRAG